MKIRTTAVGSLRPLVLCGAAALLIAVIGMNQPSSAQDKGAPPAAKAKAKATGPGYLLTDPPPDDPALKGAIDLHAHQDPDSNGSSYPTQSARSLDALDLYTRAKASGMRGFVIKTHLDPSAGLAYYIRKLHPDMEVFGGMGSNLTTGTKVNPWAIKHLTEMKGGWGRIVWMPSWDSEFSIHKSTRRPPGYVAVAQCGTLPFWINYPKPCADGGELLPEVKEAIHLIATLKTRDSNGDLVLATGHNSWGEVKLMVKEAVKEGVKHIIITHPLLDSVEMTNAEITEVVGMGPEIYAEFTAGSFGTSTASEAAKKTYAEGIRAAGVEHAFVSTDTGQLNSMFQPDALAGAAKVLRANGFTEHELDLLFKINPAKILGLPLPAGTR